MANWSIFDMEIEGKRKKDLARFLAPENGYSSSNITIPRLWVFNVNQEWVTDDNQKLEKLFENEGVTGVGGHAKWSFISSAIVGGQTTLPKYSGENRKERNALAINILRDIFDFIKLSEEEAKTLDEIFLLLAEKIGKQEKRFTFPEKDGKEDSQKRVFEKVEKAFEREQMSNLDNKRRRLQESGYVHYPSALTNYVRGIDLLTLEEIEGMEKDVLNWFFVSISAFCAILDLNVKVWAEEPNMDIKEEIHIDRYGWLDALEEE